VARGTGTDMMTVSDLSITGNMKVRSSLEEVANCPSKLNEKSKVTVLGQRSSVEVLVR
jgi:hypothetical protein